MKKSELRQIIKEEISQTSNGLDSIYDWLENAYMNKRIGNLDKAKEVRKELTILKKATTILWKYQPLIDANVKPEEYFQNK